MRIYLAGTYAEIWHGGGRLDGLLVDDLHGRGFDQDVAGRVNMLESYYYVADWQTRNLHRFKSFMLDSGAYTFAYSPRTGGAGVDWDAYLDEYARYIVENGVELFMELDIDPLVGYPRVRELRSRLEALTGRRCIPVWHRERGWDDWLRTCEEYDYVAIGGIADRGRTKVEPYLPRLTREAHRRGAKVHGLGYTSLANLLRSGLDSVDSAAWLSGNRGGYAYQWDGRTMRKIDRGPGQRANTRELARHNFMEWVKMAEQMEG